MWSAPGLLICAPPATLRGTQNCLFPHQWGVGVLHPHHYQTSPHLETHFGLDPLILGAQQSESPLSIGPQDHLLKDSHDPREVASQGESRGAGATTQVGDAVLAPPNRPRLRDARVLIWANDSRGPPGRAPGSGRSLRAPQPPPAPRERTAHSA